MKKLVLLLFIVFSLQITIAQEYEMIRHQVQLGETVRMISRKYKIEPAEIYRMNKFAVDGISQGQVLQLFVPVKETAAETTATVAQDDESSTSVTTKTVTMTTVRKKKSVESEPLTEETTSDAEGGDLGQISSAVAHTVSNGETLSGIAKQYGVSIADIRSQNEKVLRRGLQPGQILTIVNPGGEPATKQEQLHESESATTESSSSTEIRHKVQKGDTLFDLARKYNVSVDEIKAQNESTLKKGLQPGQILTITMTN